MCGTVPPPSFCDGVIRSGRIMLAWKSATPALSGYGYKIFRVDGGRHDLVVFVYNTWAALAKNLSQNPT